MALTAEQNPWATIFITGCRIHEHRTPNGVA